MGSRGQTFPRITARTGKLARWRSPRKVPLCSFSTMKSLGKPYSLCCIRLATGTAGTQVNDCRGRG